MPEIPELAQQEYDLQKRYKSPAKRRVLHKIKKEEKRTALQCLEDHGYIESPDGHFGYCEFQDTDDYKEIKRALQEYEKLKAKDKYQTKVLDVLKKFVWFDEFDEFVVGTKKKDWKIYPHISIKDKKLLKEWLNDGK